MKKLNLLGAANLCFAVGLVCMTGCTTVNTVERAQPIGERQMVSDKRISTDGSLNRKVSIIGVNEGMTPGGLVKAQVEVLNRTRSTQRFNYRFEWFDANGMQVNTVASALIPCQIEGKESKMISSVAPTPLCEDFRVKFIE